MDTRPVVIVDPYTSGAYLAPEFASQGVRSVMLQASAEVPDVYAPSLRREHFDLALVHRGDIEETVAQVRAIAPRAVIAGCETGVELADQLSEALGLRTNGSRLSAARRNKYLMIEAIRANGLKAARQIATDDLDAALSWTREICPLPVIVKPLSSAGTDSVSLCRVEEDVRAAFGGIIGTKNKLDLINAQVLVQEYLVGDEYVVDTVSRDGQHHVTDIWRYEKHSGNGASFVYHSVELLPSDAAPAAALVAYTRRALDALGIQNGPGHSEVILTEEGPALVEMGARIHGGNTALICRDCIGHGQIDLTADVYLEGGAFSAVAGATYPLHKHAKAVFFIAQREGRLVDVPGLAAIEALPSYHGATLKVRPGGRVQRTVDLFSAPGWVTLLHRDKAVIDADERRIREIEREELFRLE
ncbi:ATP-grasp domain-containing protein [Sorangium sp. So ce1014]|uniref:ATP-grasp domain-containing protein n=1 Tax=Sorangium sp. So ce1014 TaxID=3133326 RepID=UPI003F648934